MHPLAPLTTTVRILTKTAKGGARVGAGVAGILVDQVRRVAGGDDDRRAGVPLHPDVPDRPAPPPTAAAPPPASAAPPVPEVPPTRAADVPPPARPPAPEVDPMGPPSQPEFEPRHIEEEEPEIVGSVAEEDAEDGAGANVRIAEPWDGYDRMTAADVTDRLAVADAATLAAVRLYESEKRGRKTVVEEVDRRLARVG